MVARTGARRDVGLAVRVAAIRFSYPVIGAVTHTKSSSEIPARFKLGVDRVNRGEDWLYERDVAQMGEAIGTRRWPSFTRQHPSRAAAYPLVLSRAPRGHRRHGSLGPWRPSPCQIELYWSERPGHAGHMQQVPRGTCEPRGSEQGSIGFVGGGHRSSSGLRRRGRLVAADHRRSARAHLAHDDSAVAAEICEPPFDFDRPPQAALAKPRSGPRRAEAVNLQTPPVSVESPVRDLRGRSSLPRAERYVQPVAMIRVLLAR